MRDLAAKDWADGVLMTADDWEVSTDALDMLRAVHGRWRDQEALHRRLHRYYLGCCRAIWPLLPQRASRRIVELAEQYLDGRATDNDLAEADWDAEGAAFNLDYGCDPETIQGWVEAVEVLPAATFRSMLHTAEGRALAPRKVLTQAAYFANFAGSYPYFMKQRPDPRWTPFLCPRLLRCAFANPMRPLPSAHAWRTPDVTGLARAIDEDAAFDRLPLLADALMDAGCEDGTILCHCRGRGPHVLGCWVVDLVLGKK